MKPFRYGNQANVFFRSMNDSLCRKQQVGRLFTYMRFSIYDISTVHIIIFHLYIQNSPQTVNFFDETYKKKWNNQSTKYPSIYRLNWFNWHA